jgi:putative FmdB family regulatory protein
MPLYEYRCTSCGERIEVLQHLGAAPLAECPHCGGVLVKLISASALQFKGTGWYVTDYGHRHTTSAGNGESNSKDAGAKPSEGSSAAKPASKAAEKPAAAAGSVAKAS